MKISEGLKARADKNKAINRIKSRISYNAVLQEGDKPIDDIKELTQDLENLYLDMLDLIKKINHTNNSIKILDYIDNETQEYLKNNNDLMQIFNRCISLNDLLAEREIARQKANHLKILIEETKVNNFRSSSSEIKMYSPFDVKELMNDLEKYNFIATFIDNFIQKLNWTIDLQ